MDNLKSILIAVVVSAVVAGGIVVAIPDAPSYRGVASPDILSPYMSFGDVRLWAANDDDLTAATTTICALQSPAATSTLIYGGVKLTTSTTSASTVHLAKATTAFATTTSLGSAAFAAGAFGTVVASSSPLLSSPLDPSQVFAPNTWFVVGFGGGQGTHAGMAPTGSCQAVWLEN